jgi:pimeloyl-ACP methyl ester carboxylesterase
VGDIAALAATSSDPSWPRPDPLGVTWRLGALATWSSLPVLNEITSPTIAIAGVRDRVIPSATTDMLAALIPGAVLVGIDADHDLQAPAATVAFAAVVEQFLSH